MSDTFNLDNIQAQGDLTPGSVNLLSSLGNKIARANRAIVPVQVKATEVTFLSILADNSPSVRSFLSAIIAGCNVVPEALRKAKKANSFEIQLNVLNSFGGNQGIVYDYCPVTGAPRLDPQRGIEIAGVTPLFDQTMAVLGDLARKCADAEENDGISVRSQTLIITDGFDYGSQHFDAGDCAQLIGDLVGTEKHRVLFCGVGNEGDFRPIGLSMGIPDDCIQQIPATEKAIRAMFMAYSESADHLSQAANPADVQGFNVQLG